MGAEIHFLLFRIKNILHFTYLIDSVGKHGNFARICISRLLLESAFHIPMIRLQMDFWNIIHLQVEDLLIS